MRTCKDCNHCELLTSGKLRCNVPVPQWVLEAVDAWAHRLEGTETYPERCEYFEPQEGVEHE